MLTHTPLLDYEESFVVQEDFDLHAMCGPDPNPAEATRLALEWAKSAKAYEFEADAIKAHIGELQAKIERKRNTASKLRLAALGLMRAHGLTKVKDEICTASITKGRERLVVIDEASIPDEWWRIKREIAKADIMKHIKETGEVPDGCDLEQGEDSLTVRI
jgi:hypothetical protein